MNSNAFQVHKWWFLPAALLLVITALAECAAVLLMPHPALWAGVIAATLPLSMTLFVIIPMLRQQSRRS